jgi:hypothetical protein
VHDDVQFRSETETGLKLPDGTLVFPPDTWHGRGVLTNEDRAVIVAALQESANHHGIPVADMLDKYKWHVREKMIITVTRRMDGRNHDLDDPTLTDQIAEIVDGEGPSEPPGEWHE